VRRAVCLLVTATSCAETAEPIEMSFVLWTPAEPKNCVLVGGPDFPGGRGIFTGVGHAMRPFDTILRLLVYSVLISVLVPVYTGVYFCLISVKSRGIYCAATRRALTRPRVCRRSRATRCSCTGRGRWTRSTAAGASRRPAASTPSTSTTWTSTTSPEYSPRYASASRTSS